ncbi:MAG: hypothetical protein JNJ83_12660 [Verrucomicrobiaceae bacterium]|nr:hypothetical protein [Verrucomicrobiaceae bacterium]
MSKATLTKSTHSGPGKASTGRKLPAAERRQKLGAMCYEVAQFWKGKARTGALSHLLAERHGVRG